ncbi:citryl-CoA lyase, partial [Bordetella pertussis]
MNDMHHFTTAISKIVSTPQEEETIIRGHRLSDLIREQPFVASAFLLLTGRLPDAGEARTLDAVLTACVDHGVTPAAAIGRTFASYGAPIAQAMAGAALLYGDVAGGVGDPLAAMMKQAIAEAGARNGAPGEHDVDAAAGNLVAAALRAG